MRVQQMSAVRRSVRFSDHYMRVQFVLAAFILGKITEKRHDLDLLLDLDAFVIFALALKETQRDLAESSNCRNVTSLQSIFFCKLQQALDNFIAFVEDERVRSRSFN